MRQGEESVLWSIWKRADGGHVAMQPGKTLRSGVLVCYCSEGRDQAKRLAKEFDLDARGRSRRYGGALNPTGNLPGEKG